MDYVPHQVSDGEIMAALEDDLKHYHLAEARRDIADLHRIRSRLSQREVDSEQIEDADEWLKARRLLAEVRQDPQPMAIPEPREPIVREAFVRAVPAPYEGEGHLQRHWPAYVAVVAVCGLVALVLWVVVQLVNALVAAVATLVAAVAPFLGGLGLLLLIVFLCSLGRGGKSFSGTFQGRMH